MKRLFVLIAGVAVSVGSVRAETVGFWTFDGTEGEALPGAVTTIANRVDGSSITMTTGSNDSGIPVPSYADEIQGRRSIPIPTARTCWRRPPRV